MSEVLVVVLAGGDGERLWPLSRRDHPKAFLPLAGVSPLQAAVRMAQGLGRVLVVCRDEHRFIAAEQLRASGVEATLLLEPSPRGDGAALALAGGIRGGDYYSNHGSLAADFTEVFAPVVAPPHPWPAGVGVRTHRVRQAPSHRAGHG